MSFRFKKPAFYFSISVIAACLGYYVGTNGGQPKLPEAPITPNAVQQAAESSKTEVVQEAVPPQATQAAADLRLQSMTGLTVRSVADIEIFKSDTPSFQIVGESQEVIDSLKTEMVGTNLIISHVLTKPLQAKCGNTTVMLDVNGTNSTINVNTGGKTVKSHCALVKIGVKEIPAIQVEKSGNVHFAGADQKQLLLKIAGSGNITGEGKVDDLLLWVSGSGNIDTSELKAQQLRILSQGSGDVEAAVSGSLESALQGSGNVTVIGDPAVSNHQEYGSGKFRLYSTSGK